MLKRLATRFLPVHGAKTPQTQHTSFKNVLTVLARNRVLNPIAIICQMKRCFWKISQKKGSWNYRRTIG